MKGIVLCAAMLAAVACEKEPQPPVDKLPGTFYKGLSMQFASYLEDNGTVAYKENGAAKDPYRSIADHGGNMVRLYLEPEVYPRNAAMDAETPPAPDIDWAMWPRVKDDMLRAKAAGLDVEMTLKLEKSVPPMWRHITDREELGRTFYDWCYAMLDQMGKQGTMPKIVSIGNEINASFMSPEEDIAAGVYDYERNVFFVNKGIKAVRDIETKYKAEIKVAVHIFSPSNVTWWLGEHYNRGLTDFDILALSYYYGFEGHSMGGWRNWAHLGQYLKNTIGKDFMILETSFPWTNQNGDTQFNPYNAVESGYTASPADQRRWLADFAKEIRAAGGLGVITWGNESLPTTAWIYNDPSWGKGSSWENNSCWNFEGNLHEGIDWMNDVK